MTMLKKIPTLKTLLFSAYVRYIDGERLSASAELDAAAPGAVCRSATSSSARGYANGLSRTPSRTLNTAVFAPMAIASVSTTTAVTVELRRRARTA